MKLKPSSKNSFGAKREEAERSIGLNGKSFVNLSPKVEWGLRIYQCSMMRYWRNKLGRSYMTKHHCSIGCLSQNSFQQVQLWRQPIRAQLHMHGVV